MLTHKCDILNLEWGTNSRDENIVEPVLVYLEEKYNLTIIRDSIWYGCFKLAKYRPKLLILANEMGAVENVNIMRLAYQLGITTVSLISEGLNYYQGEDEEVISIIEQFWGHNLKKEKITDLKLVWSKSTLNKFNKYINGISDYDIQVSGATGFDRYKLLDFVTKEEFLKVNNKTYKQVILVSGYGFDSNLVNAESSIITKGDSASEMIKWLKKNRNKLNDIYKSLIRENPNILFILKHHPGDIDLSRTEFMDLVQYPNVMLVHKEIGIDHLINVCDLLIAFDSTTCMEAWLLNKTTIIVNPYEEDFFRSSIYKGCAMAKTYKQLQDFVNEYYFTKKINDFQMKENLRDQILKENIEHYDGKNHERAGEIINKVFTKGNSRVPHIGTFFYKEIVHELKEFIIEYTFIGWFNLNRKKYLTKRHHAYSKKERKKNTEKYRIAIQKIL